MHIRETSKRNDNYCFRKVLPLTIMIGKWLHCFLIPKQRFLNSVAECCPCIIPGCFNPSFPPFPIVDGYDVILQEAEVPIINNKVCEELHNPLGSFLPPMVPFFHEDIICAGKNKDSCKVRVYP